MLVHGDEVQVVAAPQDAQPVRQALRVGLGVVLAGQQHVFKAEFLPAFRAPVVQGPPQPGQVPHAVHGHGAASGLVRGGVEAQRQQGPGLQLRQFLDAAHQARGAHGDAVLPQAQARRMAHEADGAVQVVEVVQGLAHAHEYERELMPAVRPQLRHEGQHLAQDLAGLQVAQDAHAARGAEGAAHGAAHLAGDAVGHAGVPHLAGHVDGLDALPVRQLQRQLRGAVRRGLAFGDGRQAQVRHARQPAADARAQVRRSVLPGPGPVQALEGLQGAAGAAQGLEILREQRPSRGQPLPLGGGAVPGHGEDIGHMAIVPTQSDFVFQGWPIEIR